MRLPADAEARTPAVEAADAPDEAQSGGVDWLVGRAHWPYRDVQGLARLHRSSLRIRPRGVLVAAAVCVAVGTLDLGADRAPLQAAPFPPRGSTAEASITRADLRGLVGYLADDARAGRGVNHRGNAEAVAFIAAKLASFGVRPAVPGFLQAVPLHLSTLNDDTRLELAPPERRRWNAGDDYYPLAASPDADVAGPPVFAAHGLVDPSAGVDDYRHLDVRGRVVIVSEGRPGDPPRDTAGAPLWDAELETRKARDASALGALALVVVTRERRLPGFRATWPARPSVRQAAYHLADDHLPLPVVRVSARVGAALRASAEGAPDRVVRVRVALTTRSVSAPNVLGVIDGVGDHAAELIVLGAHLDHDGVDGSGTVYNGADDDASGTAAVLEIAQALSLAVRDGWRPRRSILLACWNAEEKGLLGSTYFTTHVRPEARRPVANLNLDMVGRREDIPRDNDPRFGRLPARPGQGTRAWFHVVGYTFSPDLAAIVRDEAPAVRLNGREEYDEHPVNLLRRSDHWPFLRLGIPALFLTTGLHPDYHTPRDDVDAIDFDILERMARLALRVTWRLAETGTIPSLTATPAAEP